MIARAVLLTLQARTLAARARLAVRTLGARRRAPPGEDGPLRALFLSQYPASFAGTKYRLSLWAERLRRAGHEVEVVPAVPSPHAERLSGDWSVRARAEFHRRLLRARTPAVLRADEFDVALLHMSDLPFWEYGEPFVARALCRLAGRVLLDLDDLPVVGGEPTLRPRTNALARAVDGLTLGTTDLLAHFPGKAAWLVPTCVEPAEWTVPDRAARSGPAVLGWVGSAGNARYLERIAPALAEVCERHGARVRVVGAAPPDLPGVPVEFVPWSAAGEVESLAPMDVGLAPLADGPMERAKCGLKALQYMASGLPVVASPVGALARIVEDGRTGFLAGDQEAWTRRLGDLLSDRELRLRLGDAGRRSAEESWSFDAHADRFEAALRGLRPDRPGA